MISVKFGFSTPIKNSGFFSAFYTWLSVNKEPVEEEIKKLLEDYARDGHRDLPGRHYENQTGRLRKSTKARGSLASQIELYVDLAEAPYGEFVIDGHGTWEGDGFIEETLAHVGPKIREIIEQFYADAVNEFNRR